MSGFLSHCLVPIRQDSVYVCVCVSVCVNVCVCMCEKERDLQGLNKSAICWFGLSHDTDAHMHVHRLPQRAPCMIKHYLLELYITLTAL